MRFNEYPLNASKERTPVRAIFCPSDRYAAVLYRECGPSLYALDTGNAVNLGLTKPASWADFRLVPSQKASAQGENVEVALVLPAEGVVRRFNLDRKEAQPTVQCRDALRCAYSFDGSLMAVGTTRGKVEVWRLTDESGLVGVNTKIKPERIGEFDLSRKAVVSLAFNCTNLLLYAVLASGEVRLIDLKEETDAQLKPEDDSWRDFDCLTVHTHRNKPSYAAFGGFGSQVWTYNIMSKVFRQVETGLGAYVASVRVVTDHKIAAVGQNGVFSVDPDSLQVGGFFLRPDNTLIVGGTLSRNAFGSVAFVKVASPEAAAATPS